MPSPKKNRSHKAQLPVIKFWISGNRTGWDVMRGEKRVHSGVLPPGDNIETVISQMERSTRTAAKKMRARAHAEQVGSPTPVAVPVGTLGLPNGLKEIVPTSTPSPKPASYQVVVGEPTEPFITLCSPRRVKISRTALDDPQDTHYVVVFTKDGEILVKDAGEDDDQALKRSVPLERLVVLAPARAKIASDGADAED